MSCEEKIINKYQQIVVLSRINKEKNIVYKVYKTTKCLKRFLVLARCSCPDIKLIINLTTLDMKRCVRKLDNKFVDLCDDNNFFEYDEDKLKKVVCKIVEDVNNKILEDLNKKRESTSDDDEYEEKMIVVKRKEKVYPDWELRTNEYGRKYIFKFDNIKETNIKDTNIKETKLSELSSYEQNKWLQEKRRANKFKEILDGYGNFVYTNDIRDRVSWKEIRNDLKKWLGKKGICIDDEMRLYFHINIFGGNDGNKSGVKYVEWYGWCFLKDDE
jgi:hypothetical protein